MLNTARMCHRLALRAIYAIVEDLLKAIEHQEDIRVRMSDAEVITATSLKFYSIYPSFSNSLTTVSLFPAYFLLILFPF